MERPKPHPRLISLYERFAGGTSAITLRGFVGPSAEGVVRLYLTPNGGEFMEIQDTAIIHFEQADVSDATELFVDPLAMVTVVSTRKVPLVALAMQQQNGGTGTGGKTCLEKESTSARATR